MMTVNWWKAGLEGNIAVRVKPHRPLGLFKEYRDNPEKTAEAFQGDWYYTGDRAYKDEDRLFLVCKPFR